MPHNASLPRVAFSTLAFPDATLASALSLGRRWEKRWHPEIAPPEAVFPQYARALRALLASAG